MQLPCFEDQDLIYLFIYLNFADFKPCTHGDRVLKPKAQDSSYPTRAYCLIKSQKEQVDVRNHEKTLV